MAVGIDYSLFYLRRTREERAAGRSTAEALRIAAHTSGRAIIVSGLTVMIALAGLFLTGIDVFSGVAIGTILVVGVAVLGSLTFLPRSCPCSAREQPRPDPVPRPAAHRRARVEVLGALARAVVRRPLAWGGVATIVLLALAAPALRLNLEDPGIHSLPLDVPVVHALADISDAFPGGPVPAEVVVTGDDLSGGRQVSRGHRRPARAGRRPPTARSASRSPRALFGPHDQVLVVSVPLAGSGTNADVEQRAGHAARPGPARHAGQGAGDQLRGGRDHRGQPRLRRAAGQDRSPLGLRIRARAGVPAADGQRSVRSAIPALSIGLNLLSVGAAYGLMILIFQDGHLQGPLGFTAYGGITPWLPLFMFVLLFGLSMDYHVFILSRIRELRLRGASATDGGHRRHRHAARAW